MKTMRIIFSVLAVAVIIAFAGLVVYGIVTGTIRAPDVEYMPDGTAVYKVEIDGHTYLKTDQQLTHSASCSCLGLQPAER